MAAGDLTITVANIRPPSESSNVKVDTAGEAFLGGELAYRKDSDQKLWGADADLGDDESTLVGFVLMPADADGPVVYCDAGTIKPGATLVKGKTYILSDTAKKITVDSDATTGWRKSIFGVATSTTELEINIWNSGVTLS